MSRPNPRRPSHDFISLGGPRSYEGEVQDLPTFGSGPTNLTSVDILRALALYWGAHKLLGGLHASFTLGQGTKVDGPMVDVPFLLGPAIGALWGTLVELDDSVGSKPAAPKSGAPAPAKKA